MRSNGIASAVGWWAHFCWMFSVFYEKPYNLFIELVRILRMPGRPSQVGLGVPDAQLELQSEMLACIEMGL